MEDMGIYECTISNYCGHVDITPIKVDVREVVRMPEKMVDKMICGASAEKVELVSSAVGENYYGIVRDMKEIQSRRMPFVRLRM